MYFRPPKFIKRLFSELTWNLPGTGVLYLTFDDGPNPQVTPWVLDQLAKYDAKATFFCIGKNAELYPEIVERIKAEGHAIGNHTYSHTKGWGKNAGAYFEDVELANGFLGSTLFRPPYGRVSAAQIRRLSARYHIIMWDILSRDYSAIVSPRKCIKEVVPHIREGSIIVFHDSLKASRNLYYALPRILENIHSRGYRCHAIDL